MGLMLILAYIALILVAVMLVKNHPYSNSKGASKSLKLFPVLEEQWNTKPNSIIFERMDEHWIDATHSMH
jgi:hypothetical protein